MKKRFKKALSLMLAAMLLISCINVAAAETPEEQPAAAAESSAEATEEPSAEPTVEPTVEPTPEPTLEPTPEPTVEPTPEPTAEPTLEPTEEPTAEPTSEPTVEPTVEPTTEPTAEPSIAPTALPTATPSAKPSTSLSPTPCPKPAKGRSASIPGDANKDGYHDGDVAIINKVIDNNGLSAKRDSPKDWDFATWSQNGAKRLIKLNLGSYIMSGRLDLRGLSALTELSAGGTRIGITGIDVSGCKALTTLYCAYSPKLSYLNVSGCTALITLNCGNATPLSSLDVSSCTALEKLDCWGTQLTSLDVKKCTKLRELAVVDTKITTLDVSGLTALTELYCPLNKITSLNLRGCSALTRLVCSTNQLKTLDLSWCGALTTLECGENQLKSLNLNPCPQLQSLSCGSNQLAELKVNNLKKLSWIYCMGNDFTSLDLSGMSNLNRAAFSVTKLISPDGYVATVKGSQGQKAQLRVYESEGKKLTLNAPEASGYLFDSWSCSTSLNADGSTSTSLKGNMDIVAKYTKIQQTDVNSQDKAAFIKIIRDKKLSAKGISETDISTWPVIINKQDGSMRITKVTLKNMGISGSLDLSGLPCLTEVRVGDNKITSLKLPQKGIITVLNCSNNLLEELNLKNAISGTHALVGGNPLRKYTVSDKGYIDISAANGKVQLTQEIAYNRFSYLPIPNPGYKFVRWDIKKGSGSPDGKTGYTVFFYGDNSFVAEAVFEKDAANVPLTSFTLSKTSVAVSKGKTYALKVTAYTPSNTTSSKTAAWKSSNTKIATVDSKGVVKGIANGTATITCTVAGISKTCKITVGTPLTSFTLNKTSATVSKGKTYSLKVTAYTPSNTTSSKTATWKSSNTKIATVDSKGVVKGIANGTATITCTVAGISKTCKITVGTPLTSFTLSKTSATVSKGKTYALKVTAYSPSNTTSSKTATWKSSNTKIATVDSKGVVKGIANGTATITCTVAGISKTCKITVGTPLTSFTLSKTSATVSKGKTYVLKVTAYSPSNTTSSKTATWKSSNTKIATVDSKGVVKGIANGTATITCTVAGISKTCKITVGIPLKSFTLSKTSAAVSRGKTYSLKVTAYSPSNTTSSKTATWKSSNTKIATVDSKGVVKGIANGTATITCTVAGIKKTCKITVGIPLKSFTLSKTSATVSKGKTYALKVTAYSPSNTTSSKTAAWKSSNTKIATVSSKGVVKGIAKGTATITCTVAGVKKSCKLTVK